MILLSTNGDAALFARSDGIETAWRLIDPIMKGWESSSDAPPLTAYEPGSWGPAGADELLARSGHVWRLGCGGHGE